MKDWRNIDYLVKGNAKQKQCHKILVKYKILEILKNFNPIVIGTIPIEIDIEGSDIDIACQSNSLASFSKLVRKEFSCYLSFKENLHEDSYSASFKIENMPIDIYAESLPAENQNGYRHMVIEKRILDMGNASFKDKIIELRRQGYKTEPAFGKLLNMKDAYTELLYLEKLNDSDLKNILTNFIL